MTFVFQMSLDNCQIPDDRRIAYAVPFYKRGDTCSAEDYRSVTIGSICSVMEHILFFNITQHLYKNYILMDAQHGFRKKTLM